MLKYFLIVLLIVSIVIPGVSLAAQDVVLTDKVNVTLTDPAMTMVIHGAKFDQIVVNTNNIVITISANAADQITITTTDRYRFTVSGITDPGTECNAGDSRVVLPTQNSAVAVTITPSTVCTVTSSSGGGGVSTLNLSPAPAAPMTAPITTTGTVTATTMQGGETTYISEEGTKAAVNIPSEALSANTTFSISPIVKTSPSVSSLVSAIPSGSQIIGANLYEYSATLYTVGTIVTTFSKDLTLSFTYSDSQVKAVDISTLKVHYYSESEKKWIALPSTVDAGLKKVTATTSHFTRFALLAYAEGTAPKPEVAVSLVDISGKAIVDGDLIKTAQSFDIYIVKLIGSKKFKRLILNPDIFNSYRHLKWENVKTVSQAVQDAYTLSELVIEVNEDGSVFDPKVYRVSSALNSDVGIKQWLNITAAQFAASGRDWDAIYKINHTEASKNFYPQGTPITS